jgi:tRNA(adenine34) deaminase
MLNEKNDEFFMKEALKEALKAKDANEIPIGAIIVSNNTIIARAHNYTERLNDVTAHAEMQAFTAAANFLGSKYLKNCTLYVTLEPCIMCAGAAYWTQISKIVFGAYDSFKGYQTIKKYNILHPTTTVIGGICEEECSSLIKQFFKNKRYIKP